MMRQTIEAFEKRGAQTFYHSLAPEAKAERWQRREAKINERKNQIKPETVIKIVEKNDRQLSLFE